MQIQENTSIKELTTFGVEAMAKQLVIIEQHHEIAELSSLITPDDKMLILGQGSNTLFTQDFEGTVIQINTKGFEIVKEDHESVILKVAAGEKWESLISFVIEKGYYGIENLSAIPGSVGASPVQNIGAYGTEIKEAIECVEGIFLDSGESFLFNNQQCEFDYRSSIFKTKYKNRVIITFVYFKLSKREHYTLHYAGLEDELKRNGLSLSLQNISSSVISIRNRKLPDVNKIGSAGSFFKNPIITKVEFKSLTKEYPQLIHYDFSENEIKLSAGQLIELCGWKGYRQGDAGVYPQQALVIVNYGKATGKEIKELSIAIQKSVKEKFRVDIVAEVNIIENS